MFEAAELDRAVAKADYGAEVATLRVDCSTCNGRSNAIRSR
jgi:hypothetical protein